MPVKIASCEKCGTETRWGYACPTCGYWNSDRKPNTYQAAWELGYNAAKGARSFYSGGEWTHQWNAGNNWRYKGAKK